MPSLLGRLARFQSRDAAALASGSRQDHLERKVPTSWSTEATRAGNRHTHRGDDKDTAFTSEDPFSLFIDGVQSKDDVVQLGSKYDNLSVTGAKDWSELSLPALFDGKGAILVVSAPDGLLPQDYSLGQRCRS